MGVTCKPRFNLAKMNRPTLRQDLSTRSSTDAQSKSSGRVAQGVEAAFTELGH